MDKDIELLKIQYYSNHCHTIFTSRLSFGLALFIALSLALCAVIWQGLSANSILLGGFGFIIVLVLTVAYLGTIRRDYDESFKYISDMIETVKQGKELPKLEDLGKIELEKNAVKDVKKQE